MENTIPPCISATESGQWLDEWDDLSSAFPLQTLEVKRGFNSTSSDSPSSQSSSDELFDDPLDSSLESPSPPTPKATPSFFTETPSKEISSPSLSSLVSPAPFSTLFSHMKTSSTSSSTLISCLDDHTLLALQSQQPQIEDYPASSFYPPSPPVPLPPSPLPSFNNSSALSLSPLQQSLPSLSSIPTPSPSPFLPTCSSPPSVVQTLKLHYWQELQKLAAQQQILQYHLMYLKMLPFMDTSSSLLPGRPFQGQELTFPLPQALPPSHSGVTEIQTSTGSYLCSYPGCSRILKSRFSLRRHISAHNGIKPFRCNFANCGKKFAESNTLARHRRIHTGEKPFRCEIPGCNRAFSDASNWRRHETSHSGAKPFACPYNCEARYCRKTSLTNHIQKAHSTQS